MKAVHDCEFVALAEDLRIPLVTMDKKVLTGLLPESPALQGEV